MVMKIPICQARNWQKNHTKQLLEHFKKKNSQILNKIWTADLAYMQLKSKFNKTFVFCYVLLTFLVNMHGLFL